MATNIELADNAAYSYIAKHQPPSIPGHDLSHLRNVARLTELVGLIAGYNSRTMELARITGWFHDFKRSPNEANQEADAKESAIAAGMFVSELDRQKVYQTELLERPAIREAILKHSRPPDFFEDKPDHRQWSLPERLTAALFVADKLEANGVWVIARRSQFVAGTRMRHPKEADLPKYGLQPGQDEVKAVLLESAVRIAFVNPEGIYPAVFYPLTSPMYTPQREFIYGLLASKGISSLEDYAKMILGTKLLTDPAHPNYLKVQLQGRDMEGPEDSTALARVLKEKGGLSDDRLTQIEPDLIISSLEAIYYFSSHYKLSLKESVQKWQPNSIRAREWREEMVRYMNGEWFNQTKEQLTRK